MNYLDIKKQLESGQGLVGKVHNLHELFPYLYLWIWVENSVIYLASGMRPLFRYAIAVEIDSYESIPETIIEVTEEQIEQIEIDLNSRSIRSR